MNRVEHMKGIGWKKEDDTMRIAICDDDADFADNAGARESAEKSGNVFDRL